MPGEMPEIGDDEDAAGLGEHPSGRQLGLGSRSRAPGAMIFHAAGLVPGRGDGPASELDRDGALNGAGGAVGSLPGPEGCQASSITTLMLHLAGSVRWTGEYMAKPGRRSAL